jgi:hypothetical protein
MNALLRTLILGIAAAGALVVLAPAPVQADDDDYWDGYWSWYDGTYRPYYHRRYYSARPRYYDDGYYGDGYYDRSYSGGYYYGPRYRYGGEYYGTPRFGYREFPGGGQVQVGALRFGWR